MNRRGLHAVLRGFFYLWFSLAAGLTATGVLEFVLAAAGYGSVGLPGGPAVTLAIAALLILAMLVFGQWEQFGQRIRLLRWIPLCVVFTATAAFGLALSLGGSRS